MPDLATLIEAIRRIENGRTGLRFFGALFFCVATLRILLEGASQKLQNFPSLEWTWFFAHSYLFYGVCFLGLATILCRAAKEAPGRTARFVFMILLPLILLPPVLDLAVSGGKGAVMAYQSGAWTSEGTLAPARSLGNYLLKGSLGLAPAPDPKDLQTNYGIRLELGLILLISVWYVFLKTKTSLRAIAAFFGVLSGIWVMGNFPQLVAWVGGTNLGDLIWGGSLLRPVSAAGSNQALLPFYFLALLLAVAWLLRAHDREKFAIIARNIRLNGVIMNAIVLNSGLLFGLWGTGFRPHVYDLAILAIANLSMLFSWLWAVAENDIADIKGDKISMPHRPLPRGEVSVREMRLIGLGFLFLAVIAALLVNPLFFAVLAARGALGHLYSHPPFRLKRMLIVSNLTIGILFVLRFVGGYAIVAGADLSALSGRLLLSLLVLFATVTTLKDLKDRDGDKADGIRTLPVILGEKKGAEAVGLLGAAGMVLAALVYGRSLGLFLPLALAAGALYYLFVSGGGRKRWTGIF